MEKRDIILINQVVGEKNKILIKNSKAKSTEGKNIVKTIFVKIKL